MRQARRELPLEYLAQPSTDARGDGVDAARALGKPGLGARTERDAIAPTEGCALDDAADAAVIRRILGGDDDAFGELVRRYSKRAFYVAWHVVGSVEDARDVVQESFLRLHRSLERYDFARSFYTWFYRIVTNLAIDALRKRRASRTVDIEDFEDRPTDLARPSADLERAEERDLVWQVLDSLDPKFRAVLVLREIHGLSAREIAPILGVTHVTARWRLHRGRQLFRDAWAELTGAEGQE